MWTWTAVTHLAAVTPVIPPPSPPLVCLNMHVIILYKNNMICYMHMLIWCMSLTHTNLDTSVVCNVTCWHYVPVTWLWKVHKNLKLSSQFENNFAFGWNVLLMWLHTNVSPFSQMVQMSFITVKDTRYHTKNGWWFISFTCLKPHWCKYKNLRGNRKNLVIIFWVSES